MTTKEDFQSCLTTVSNLWQEIHSPRHLLCFTWALPAKNGISLLITDAVAVWTHTLDYSAFRSHREELGISAVPWTKFFAHFKAAFNCESNRSSSSGTSSSARAEIQGMSVSFEDDEPLLTLSYSMADDYATEAKFSLVEACEEERRAHLQHLIFEQLGPLRRQKDLETSRAEELKDAHAEIGTLKARISSLQAQIDRLKRGISDEAHDAAPAKPGKKAIRLPDRSIINPRMKKQRIEKPKLGEDDDA